MIKKFFVIKIQGTKISNECLRSSQAKRERNLMLQFLLIALVLVIYEGFFWLIPKLKSLGLISGNKTLILVNAFGILNSALPPFLYMTFGSELRRIISSKSGMVASIKSLRPNSAIGGRLVVSQSIGGQVLRASTNIDEIDV